MMAGEILIRQNLIHTNYVNLPALPKILAYKPILPSLPNMATAKKPTKKSSNNGTAKSERVHEVHAELSNVQLVKAKSSLKLTVYADGSQIGEIQIGRGALYWWGHKRQKSKRVNWSKFAEMMDKLAYGA